jgi:hypothetical protein
MVTYNPTEEMVLNDGWEIYKKPETILTESDLLQQAKDLKLQ